MFSEKATYKLSNSLYHTQEQEYFDILAQYNLGEIDTNLGSETYGDVTFSRGIGSQLSHARNDLDALIFNTSLQIYFILKLFKIICADPKYLR